MGYFTMYAAITTGILALLLYFLRRYLPLRTPILLLVVLTSFLLTMIFPFLSTLVEWHHLILLYISCIMACVFIIYLIDQSTISARTEAQATAHQAESTTAAGLESMLLQDSNIEGNNENSKDSPSEIKAPEVFTGDEQQNIQSKVKEEKEEIQKKEEANEKKEKTIESSFKYPIHTEEYAAEKEALATDPVKIDYQGLTADPVFDIVKMDKVWPVIEVPFNLDPKQAALEHDKDSLPQETDLDWPPPSGSQEERRPVCDEETPDVGDELDEEKMDLNSIIAEGFSLRLSGDMPGAVKYFMNAMHFSSDAKLNVMLGSEISSIYDQNGQKWQAAEILRILLDTWGDQLEPQVKADLISNMKRLHE